MHYEKSGTFISGRGRSWCRILVQIFLVFFDSTAKHQAEGGFHVSERPIGDKYLTGNKGASLEAPSVIKDGLRGIAKTPESLYVSCTRNEPARWKSFHFFYPKVQYNKIF